MAGQGWNSHHQSLSLVTYHRKSWKTKHIGTHCLWKSLTWHLSNIYLLKMHLFNFILTPSAVAHHSFPSPKKPLGSDQHHNMPVVKQPLCLDAGPPHCQQLSAMFIRSITPAAHPSMRPNKKYPERGKVEHV